MEVLLSFIRRRNRVYHLQVKVPSELVDTLAHLDPVHHIFPGGAVGQFVDKLMGLKTIWPTKNGDYVFRNTPFLWRCHWC
jgi:hypothetical protein